MIESFESCYIYFFKRSDEDELRSLTARGVKLLCGLVVRQQILLYRLSDGSRVNRLWLGGCFLLVFFGLCADISIH